MKVIFEDKSYIEFVRNTNGKIHIVIKAKDAENSNKNIVNAVELDQEQFNKLVSGI